MGKTTLVFQLLNQLKLTSRAVLLFQTQCDSRELLRYVLSGLGLDATAQDIVTMHERLNQVLARELLVIDHQNPYFSERSPELEGDKIIIQAPGRAERSLLRARVTDHGCHPITPPVRSCAVCGY